MALSIVYRLCNLELIASCLCMCVFSSVKGKLSGSRVGSMYEELAQCLSDTETQIVPRRLCVCWSLSLGSS